MVQAIDRKDSSTCFTTFVTLFRAKIKSSVTNSKEGKFGSLDFLKIVTCNSIQILLKPLMD